MNKNSFVSIKRDVIPHLKMFWLPWLLLAIMLVVSWFSCLRIVLVIVMGIFASLFIIKPMQVVYGLIGTHGYIGMFFFLFLLINVVFAGIYYGAFFRKAGISYDVNQPHVEFNIFKKGCQDVSEMIVLCGSEKETLPVSCTDSFHYYYRTDFSWVLRNTFLTSLMQEPTDFFSAANTFTGKVQNKKDENYLISKIFHYFLIFHIMISWILLGVFISLIYQRFRNS